MQGAQLSFHDRNNPVEQFETFFEPGQVAQGRGHADAGIQGQGVLGTPMSSQDFSRFTMILQALFIVVGNVAQQQQ